MPLSFKTAASALTILIALSPATAFAVDPAAFAAKLEALFTSEEFKVQMGAGTENGDDLTFPNATLIRTSEEDGTDSIPVSLTFSGVSELSDGGYAIELLTTPDIEFTDDEMGFEMRDIRIEHLNIAASPSATTFSEGMYRDSNGSIGRIAMTHEGEEMWSIGSVTISAGIEGGEDGGPTRTEAQFAVDDMRVNFAVNPTDDLEEFTEAFGQSEFTGRLVGGSTFDTGSTQLSLDNMTLTLDGLGELAFDFGSGGWTPQFLTTLQQNYEQLQALEQGGGSAEDITKAQTALGMQLLVQLTFIGAGIRYDDQGLVNRLLDFAAASENEDRNTIVGGLKIMAAQGLMQTGMTDLAAMVSAEVNKFLDDPQSFEITARPPSPVSLILLSAAAVQPQLILNMLKLSVAANAGGASNAERPGAGDRTERVERPQRQDDSAPRGVSRVPRN